MTKAFVLLLVLIASCSRVPVRNEVASKIEAEIARGSAVDLDQLADFEWDEACFLGPFLRPVDISDVLGFKWQGKRSGGGGSVVFVKSQEPRSESEATGYFSIPGSKSSPGGKWFFDVKGCVPREQARFAVHATGAGPVTLIPVSQIKAVLVPGPFAPKRER